MKTSKSLVGVLDEEVEGVAVIDMMEASKCLCLFIVVHSTRVFC